MGGPDTGILGRLLIMVRQGIGILLLACVLAFLANAARPRTLPLFSPPVWKREMDASQPVVSIEQAERLFLYKKAVFIDARTPELYAASHIRGARNIPAGSEERYLKEALADLPKDFVLIVYGDDDASGLSRSLSGKLALVDKARKPRVLLRGWNLWTANELPIEAGPNPAPNVKAG
jgi:rhodanese-related sulfurtransferase